LEHSAERTADFRRCNHIDIEIAKCLRMLGKRLRETLSGFDSIFQIDNDHLEFPVVVLFGYRFERILKADPRADHNRKLIRKIQDVLSARPELHPEVADLLPGAFLFLPGGPAR